MLALGETPNIAARIQGLAEPNTVIISAATQRLIDGQFECQPFGSHLVKGIATPIAVYHVQSERQSRFAAGRSEPTLTPLVGREQEVGLLLRPLGASQRRRGPSGVAQWRARHWQIAAGATRCKSTSPAEGSLLFEARCSPYHQHSALYPLIERLQRTAPV